MAHNASRPSGSRPMGASASMGGGLSRPSMAPGRPQAQGSPQQRGGLLSGLKNAAQAGRQQVRGQMGMRNAKPGSENGQRNPNAPPQKGGSRPGAPQKGNGGNGGSSGSGGPTLPDDQELEKYREDYYKKHGPQSTGPSKPNGQPQQKSAGGRGGAMGGSSRMGGIPMRGGNPNAMNGRPGQSGQGGQGGQRGPSGSSGRGPQGNGPSRGPPRGY